MDGLTLNASTAPANLQALQSLSDRPANQPLGTDAARQVESMFASMLIKSMRQTLGGEGLFPGDKADALGSLFDQYLGEEISRGDGLGLARALEMYSRHAQEESA